ncbi:lysylphosphatidylglycerol synthase transmembrane domain-containing protein [Flammeovirgaceae bacterium SG7u.111]|nr:lysylphosphatidylglycerol synthase transmembrane domain-containing protein [Flammeovirgaceae bacterium SG7u.132]WPO35471.1 lysylphosphatidylglycerol synthase transmembrane domain-containing protein [Flammeovirgaceae bacterium SG7u.111]
MKKETIIKYGKFLVKIALTCVALYFVFQKIDFRETWSAITNIHLGYFALAVLAFNASKIISAFRLNLFYDYLKLWLRQGYNLKLYYLGMFYNLFLPGSIGGDGYKVYLLKQHFEVKTRQLISATLLDRLSGMLALGMLACLFTIFTEFPKYLPYIDYVAAFATLIAIPAFYFIVKYFFTLFKPVFFPTLHLSFWVQASQVICVIFLLKALGVETYYTEYLALFLLSSAVSVLPISIGGVGVRELVFYYGIGLLGEDVTQAIALSLLFFIITAFSSLVGFPFVFNLGKPVSRKENLTENSIANN